MRKHPASTFLLILISSVSMFPDDKHSVKVSEGFVPNHETAIKIAEAVLVPIYGTDVVAKEQPFMAVLKGNHWIVQGSLPSGFKGGVALVEIDKSNGCIYRITHGK
jgi:hypothetical protein